MTQQEVIKIVLIPCVVAFVLSAISFKPYIAWLKKKQLGQFIREEGPQSHAVKAKTPTMGGLCFIVLATLVASVYLIWLRTNGSPLILWDTVAHPLRGAIVVLIVAACCGLLGFADDYGKITSQSNKGLSARLRLIIEFGLGGLLGALLWWQSALVMPVQFLPHALVPWALPLTAVFFVVIIPLLLAGTTNAVNLHDGMDGLAGGTSILVFVSLMIMLIMQSHFVYACIAAAMVGAVGGFLIYNKYRAQVFMGDTGSLFIGGMMACLVAAGGLVLWFIPLALIYIAEALSVVLQVTYFKLTKPYTPEKPMSSLALIKLKLTKRLPGDGKRLFRMAPLHHHFEAVAEDRGIYEWQVVASFWLGQLLLCMLVLGAFFRFGLP